MSFVMLNLAMYECMNSLTSEQLPLICMIILLECLQIQFGADCFKARKYTYIHEKSNDLIYFVCLKTIFFQCLEVMKAHMEALKKTRFISFSNWSKLVLIGLHLFKLVLKLI